MRITKEEIIPSQTIHKTVGIECDCCKKQYSFFCGGLEGVKDDYGMEAQEFVSLMFTGGFGSIFGDGMTYTCDICQHCLNELLGNHLKLVDEVYPEMEEEDTKESE